MSQPNEPQQNYEIQSPSLELQVRSLLPSVAGYGGLLRSTNTIVPVIDLTSAAGGASLDTSLQQALAFGSQTAFGVTNGTTAIASVPGFYRVVGQPIVASDTTSHEARLDLTDGVSTKEILKNTGRSAFPFDLIFFLDTGETLNAVSTGTNIEMMGSIRQVATSAGVLVQPSGFSF